MDTELSQQLQTIDFTPKEAIFYETLLTSGPTSILKIAKASGLKRPTLYNIVDTLLAKGLVHYVVKGKKKLIAANNPEQIGIRLAQQKQRLETLLPKLLALYSGISTSENHIREYYGLAGIRSVYSELLDSLKNNDDYLVISNQDKWYALDPDFFETFIQQRAKLSLNIRLLLQDTQQAREFQKNQDNYNETIKCLPHTVNLNINMVLTPSKMVVVQLVKPFLALVIENRSLVEMNHTIFNLIWEIC